MFYLTKKKIYTGAFPVILLLLIVFIFACQADNDNPDNNLNNNNQAPGDNNETPEIPAETAETRLEPDLPEKDFEGFTLTLLGRRHEPEMTVKHFSETGSEEENGEPMNDAVYLRNRTVEARYNITINGIISDNLSSLYSDIRTSVLAGDNRFDAAFPSIADSARLSQEGFLANLYDIPNLDLSKPWWDQRATEGLSVGGSLYFTVGDITPWADPFTLIVVVNKELISQYSLDDPYQLVRDNNWNLDRFYEMCVEVSGDTDGDGVITEFDRHGVMSGRENFVFMFIAGGESLVKKDPDDMPYAAINTDRAVNVAQKIFDMMLDSPATLLVENYFSGYSDPWFEVLRAQFRNGNGLFYMGGLEQMMIFRDLETEIGILPMPKFDSAQEEYYHVLNMHWASSLAVPMTNAQPDQTGFILEALAAESRYTVRPAFFDSTLTRKMMRDEDSVEMLDIILASRAYDPGMIYNWGDISGIFGNMLSRQTFSFSSDIERVLPRFEQQMQRAIESFLEN